MKMQIKQLIYNTSTNQVRQIESPGIPVLDNNEQIYINKDIVIKCMDMANELTFQIGHLGVNQLLGILENQLIQDDEQRR